MNMVSTTPGVMCGAEVLNRRWNERVRDESPRRIWGSWVVTRGMAY